jgi:phage major head subunit gpT-like protein
MPITDYGVNAAIGAGLVASQPVSDTLAMLARRYPTSLPAGAQEQLDFLGTVPALRQWIGPRLAKKPSAYSYVVPIDKFEGTIQLPLDWINNDKTGQVNERISDLMRRYAQWPARLIAPLLNNGETGTPFDGQSFFSNTHSWGNSGTIDNLLTFAAATGTTPPASEAATAIVEAVTAMSGFLDDSGEPINEGMSSITIVTPTGAMGAAVRQAALLENLDTGTGVRDNPVLGLGLTIKVINSARITADRMFVINTSPGSIPFVFLENQQDRGVTQKASGSDFEHDMDAWEFGVKAVGAAGYGRFTDATSTQFT